jgi:formyltetrahydrofolate deformylase
VTEGSAATAILLVTCPDRKGLVAALTDFVFRHGGDIVHAEQHTDEVEGVFFQRIEFRIDDFDLDRSEILPALSPLAERLSLQCDLRFSDDVPRVAILASKQPHCLYDLLARWRMGELPAEIPLIISNHPDHAEAAAHFGVPYHTLPVTPETKAAQEREMLALLDEAKIDLVVLARYMQVLSTEFIATLGSQNVINIHHSFLPAFVGSKPYHQAFQRGVKLIGATAHYVTQVLDDGPIIEQNVVRIHHRDTVDDLIQKGRDIERMVLSRAVRWHVENRILLYGNKTVVFQ